MAYTTIDDPSAYFQTALYTGNAGTNNIVNDGNSDLQPDWVWIKNRGTSGKDHGLWDTSRGALKQINTNNQQAENNTANSLTAFNSDGFSLGSDGGPNANNGTHVAWQWKANGRTTSSNSDGDITSTIQANTTAGFSIVTYAGNGTSNQTVAHGLGATPDYLLWKNYDTDTSGWDWKTWHTGLTGTNYVRINQTGAQASSNGDIDALPGSTLFTVGNNGSTNGQSGQNHTIICYAFTSIKGYSKFGNYVGTADDDGPIIYTGFKPAWVMIKNISSTANWHMYDNKRDAINVVETAIQANTNAAEFTTNNKLDFLSNGFKIRAANEVSTNKSGDTYIYMAFAESPFVSSKGVPTTAR